MRSSRSAGATSIRGRPALPDGWAIMPALPCAGDAPYRDARGAERAFRQATTVSSILEAGR